MKIKECIERGQWVSFKEHKPTDFGLDWVLVQFVDKTGFVGLPYIAELGKDRLTGKERWGIQSDDVNLENYLNTECYASSWKIIEESPEWKKSYGKEKTIEE